MKQKLPFTGHPPDRETCDGDIKYEQALVKYLIFLNQVVQKEEGAREQDTVIPNERVEQVLQYTSKSLSRPSPLEEMEEQFFVSKYHITRKFKKYIRFTFHQYVTKKKLTYAEYLLQEYRSFNAIYSKSGFSSYPHFLKAFKREFGITPKELLERDTRERLVHYEHFEDEQ